MRSEKYKDIVEPIPNFTEDGVRKVFNRIKIKAKSTLLNAFGKAKYIYIYSYLMSDPGSGPCRRIPLS